MVFDLNRLLEMEYDDDLTLVETRITDHGRWTVYYRHVFRDETSGRYYEWCESRDATEMQDTWNYETEVECDEVRRVEKMVVVYE